MKKKMSTRTRREQLQNPQWWWRDNPKADDKGEDKHQGLPWRGKTSITTTGRPSTPSGGLCVLSPDDDTSTDINSLCLRLVTNTQHAGFRYSMHTAVLFERPGCGHLVWMWCMRVSSTDSICECTLILFNLLTQWSETFFRELTISHSTILRTRRPVKWLLDTK